TLASLRPAARHALALEQHHPVLDLRVGKPRIGSLAGPFRRLGLVDLHATAELIEGAEIVFGWRMTLRCRLLHPFGSLLLAHGAPVAVEIDEREVVLRRRVAALRSLLE